jgi:tRNA(Ile2) C34 agmatinyltransferase TiaS
MTTALLESPLSLFGEASGMRPAGGRGVTLEERLESALRSVHADGTAECPVCHARMHAEGAAGRCSGCGSTLS